MGEWTHRGILHKRRMDGWEIDLGGDGIEFCGILPWAWEGKAVEVALAADRLTIRLVEIEEQLRPSPCDHGPIVTGTMPCGRTPVWCPLCGMVYANEAEGEATS